MERALKITMNYYDNFARWFNMYFGWFFINGMVKTTNYSEDSEYSTKD